MTEAIKRRKKAAERKERALTLWLNEADWGLFEASRKILGVSKSEWARYLIRGGAVRWIKANKDVKPGLARAPRGGW